MVIIFIMLEWSTILSSERCCKVTVTYGTHQEHYKHVADPTTAINNQLISTGYLAILFTTGIILLESRII